jgi:hypothetical protein
MPPVDAGVVDQHVEAAGALLDQRRGGRRRSRRRSRRADTPNASTPAARSFATASSRRCSSRAPTPTLQPSAPSPAAISYPIPLFAPVTSAIVCSAHAFDRDGHAWSTNTV